jgi:hypothetical protein
MSLSSFQLGDIALAHVLERIGRDGVKAYQFIIRRKGFKPIAKTFRRKTDGYAWAIGSRSCYATRQV